MKLITAPWLFWAQAMVLTPNIVLIRPERRQDAALIGHEAIHCRQMRLVGMLKFWRMYVFSRKFRLASEVEAYRVQITAGGSLEECAKTLSKRYFLGISYEQAMKLLSLTA